MDQRHPSERRLAEYWFEVLAPEEQIEVSLHLLACESCRRSLESLPIEELDPEEIRVTRGEEVEAVLESAFSTARLSVSSPSTVRVRTTGQAPQIEPCSTARLVEELDNLSVECRLEAVRTDRRFQTADVIVGLLDQSRALTGEDTERALEAAMVAIEIAQGLDATSGEDPENADRLAVAWAFAGNAQRVRADFAESSKAFAKARHWLLAGSGQPKVRAKVLSREASLQRTQRRFDDAASTLLEVLGLYRELGDTRAEGQTLVLYAKVQYFVGQLDAAINTLHDADRCLTSIEPDRLTFNLQNNLFLYLVEAGRFDEAARRLPLVRDLAEHHGNSNDRLCVLWNEARLDRDSGRTQKAIDHLITARQGFIERSNAYDAALVSLDLAAIFLGEGRASETRQLVTEILPLLRARDVAPSVLAAMNLLLRAIEAETANRGLLEVIRSQLSPSAR